MSNAGISNASSIDRRRLAILAASVVLHAVVLTPLALDLFAERPPAPPADVDPPLYLDLEPRPLLRGETAREPTLAASAAPEPAPVAGEVVSSSSHDRTRNRNEDENERPAAPSPRLGVAAPPGAPPAPSDPWRVEPEGMAAAVGRSMRTGAGGCRIMDGRLNASEQRLCDDRFNEAAGQAGPVGPRILTPSEQRREAQFARDGARALAQYEARRRPLSGGVGIVGASPDCVGGNLRGTCAGAHLRPGFEMTDERLRNNRKME